MQHSILSLGLIKQRSLTWILPLWVACASCVDRLHAYFATDNFTSYNSQWVQYFQYGRDGIVYPSNAANGNTRAMTLNYNAGGLTATGRPDVVGGGAGIVRNGYWMAYAMYNTNLFSPSATQPFGFEFTRTNAVLTHTTTVDARNQVELGLWMFIWRPGVTGTNEWEIMENFQEFYDFSGDWGVAPDHTIDIGAFDGITHGFGFSNCVGISGMVSNLSNQILWDYTAAGTKPNTNVIGFRMTHDGSTIRYYANPNPRNLYSKWPNEWFFLGSRPVFWNSNVQLMFSFACKMHSTTLTANGSYSGFLVRSAAASSSYHVLPHPGGVGNMSSVALLISNRIEPFPTNAGINTVRIGLHNPESLYEVAAISTIDRYKNQKWRKVPWRFDAFPKPGEVAVRTTPSELQLIFGRHLENASPAESTVLRIELEGAIHEAPESWITSIWVNAEDFAAMPDTQRDHHATCGWQSSRFDGVIYIPHSTVVMQRD